MIVEVGPLSIQSLNKIIVIGILNFGETNYFLAEILHNHPQSIANITQFITAANLHTNI